MNNETPLIVLLALTGLAGAVFFYQWLLFRIRFSKLQANFRKGRPEHEEEDQDPGHQR